jgi:polysaccharide biosynthesis/export protein
MHRSYKRMRVNKITGIASALAWAWFSASVLALNSASAETDAVAVGAVATSNLYTIQPGDILTISVWKEPDLQAELLVRPDGGLSFPLVGDLRAEGLSVEQLQSLVTARLKKFIPDPVVTVSVKLIGGSRIYVLGKVNRPGEYPLYRPLDVMQALSLAGGTTPFASVNDIEILRRDGVKQRAIGFRYGDVEKGKALDQNMLLKSGDTVVVP